jgi:hypothetical protein
MKTWGYERRGRVVNIPASYLGGTEFKYRPGDSYRDSRFSYVSSVTPGKCQDSALAFDHDHFLSNPFQFIIHLSPFHSTLSYWKSVGN